MSRKKSGKPTAKELQTLGISTKYARRFPPAPQGKPKRKGRRSQGEGA